MRSLLIISIFFLGSTVYGQNSGLYGKKWCFDISSTGNIPLLNMVTGQMYKIRGGQLTEKMDLIDYGLRTGVSYAVKKNVAIGFEFDIEMMNIQAPTEIPLDYSGGSTSYTSIRHEALKTKTLIFMPRIAFTSKSGLLPIGLSHQIGIGYTSTKIIEKDYDYILYPTNYSGELPITSTFSEKFYDYSNDSFKGLIVMYNLNVRTPINKFMMITYGIRYNINVPFSLLRDLLFFDSGYNYDYYNSDYNTHYFDSDDAESRVGTRRLLSIIHLNIGMAFAL